MCLKTFINLAIEDNFHDTEWAMEYKVRFHTKEHN